MESVDRRNLVCRSALIYVEFWGLKNGYFWTSRKKWIASARPEKRKFLAKFGALAGCGETAGGEGERKLQWQVGGPMNMCCAKMEVSSLLLSEILAFFKTACFQVALG